MGQWRERDGERVVRVFCARGCILYGGCACVRMHVGGMVGRELAKLHETNQPTACSGRIVRANIVSVPGCKNTGMMHGVESPYFPRIVTERYR